MSRRTWFIALICLSAAAAGCAPKSYVVTTPLSGVTERPTQVWIGDVQDNLPSDVEMDKKPTPEDIAKFQTYLREEIRARKRLQMDIAADSGACCYEVRAALLEYTKGSGALRFLIGFGAGKASMTTQLKLVDTRSGETVFAGNFIGKVTGSLESGSSMFRQVSRDFAKALDRGLSAHGVR
jgi:hypothetical protein